LKHDREIQPFSELPPFHSDGRGFPVPVLAAVALVLIMTGCASHEEQIRIPDDRFGIYTPLTLPIILVGDTQEHESTGFRCTRATGRWIPTSRWPSALPNSPFSAGGSWSGPSRATRTSR
jgi:hypothetical protein